MINQILIQNLEFYGYHGIYPQEQVMGTRFRADIIVDLEDLRGFESDQIDDTLNYERIVECVLEIGSKRTFKLVEKLTQTLAETLLDMEHVVAVDVTISKYLTQLSPAPLWIGVRRRLEKA